MNAATSTVAHFLGQFARRKGLKILAAVRDREDIKSLRKTLTSHCANSVMTEEELEGGFDGRKVVLAFDAVFGAQGQKLINILTPGGTYISYGFLGGLGPDVSIAISQQLIHGKNLTFKAFGLSAALGRTSREEQQNLTGWIDSLFKEGRLTMPLLETVRWDQDGDAEKAFWETVWVADSGKVGHQKQVIMFSK